MRVDFLVGKDDKRLAKKIIRRLPTGQVRIGEPGRIEDANGNFLGWAIAHPELDGIDAIRLQYVMDSLAANDPAFTNPDLDDDGKLRASDVKALRDQIDAVPAVDAAIKAYRQAQRNTP